MSGILALIDTFESKIKMIEAALAQSASQAKQWSDNHNGLVGMLAATKEALADAQKMIDNVEKILPVSNNVESAN